MLYLFEDFRLDSNRRELYRAASQISVEPKVFDLLVHVIRNREHVVSKDDLIAAVWKGRIVSESALTTCINAARTAIGDSGEAQRLIKTLPRKGIRFVGLVRQEEGKPAAVVPTEAAPEPSPPSFALPDKPSIAVLPFTNLSGDPEQDYFADGIVEDIITALSRVHWLFVIARNSSFTYKGKAVDVKQVGRELGVRYVLEGSVRKASNRVRITGQLVDATTGAHVWADRFDGALEDIFDLQDRVAASVVGSIGPKLRQAEIERSKRKRTESLDAYDACLRGLAHYRVVTEASYTKALEFLKTAILLDPTDAPALALAARCKMRQCLYGWVPWSEPEVQEAVRFARAAVEADRDHPEALANSSMVLAYLGRDYDLAISLAERAVTLNPNSAEVRGTSGATAVLCGLVDDGIRHAKEAMKLSPLDPDTYYFCYCIALAHLLAERFGDAVSWCERAINESPNYITTYHVLAASLAHLGRLDEARIAIQKILSLQPNSTLERAARAGYRKPEHMALWLDGLRKAGLPE